MTFETDSKKGGDYGSTEEATNGTKRKIDGAPQNPQAPQVSAGKTGEAEDSERNPEQTFGQGQAQTWRKEGAEESEGSGAANHSRRGNGHRNRGDGGA